MPPSSDSYLTGIGDYSLQTLRAKAKREGLLNNLQKYRTSASTLHNVLTNPIYCGKVKFKGEIFDGSHFPLITESTFKKVQYILTSHAQTQAKTKRQFTYMGLLHCADCGCAITAEIKKGKYIYYHCTNGKGSCSKNYVREEVIDQQIKTVLQSIKLDETRLEWIKEALKLSHKEEKTFHQKMLTSFQTKINDLQSKIDKAYDDKLEGKIPEDLWTSKFKQWSNQKENLQIKLNAQQKAKEKQTLLKFLLSNSKMQGNTVDFLLKMPFSLIAEYNKSKPFDPRLTTKTKPHNTPPHFFSGGISRVGDSYESSRPEAKMPHEEKWLGWLDQIRTFFMANSLCFRVA